MDQTLDFIEQPEAGLKALLDQSRGLPKPYQQFIEHRLEWLATARPNQLPPPGLAWFMWMFLAGRGAGKTRACSEYSLDKGIFTPNLRVAVICPTTSDIRDTAFEGESGLLEIVPDGLIEKYNRSLFELRLINGSFFKGFSSETPQRLRGPQFHLAWADEIAAWENIQETWDMLMFCLRLGSRPQIVGSTTPKPLHLIRELVAREDVVKVRGSTLDNRDNLPESYIKVLLDKYDGTRLGRQELYAEILDEFEGAFLRPDQIVHVDTHPPLERIVVAVDPAGSFKPDSDENGIVVAGRDANMEGYLLGDFSIIASPEQWARRVCQLYYDYQADLVVAEQNYGGAMVESTIRNYDPNVPVKLVSASRGKSQRAEPVTLRYEQGRIKHVGHFPKLEDQLCAFSPQGYLLEGSPDRGDAAIWAFSELLPERSMLRTVLPSIFGRELSPTIIH